jgi:sugar phosphate isomerase/epimerase
VNPNQPSDLSRRTMLKVTAGTAAMLAAGVKLVAQNEPAKKIPIGVQLYSVRNEAGKDLPGVMAQIGKMGYQGVEFAGYYGWEKKPKDLRKLLDDCGVKCCGTHTGLNTLLGDALKGTIELHQILGNKFLIVPGMGADRLGTVEKCKETAKLFTDLAAKVKEQGMYVGYHAHGGDFKKIDGTTPWEALFDNASPDVVMQGDIGNTIGGGGDPYALLKKYPGRSLTIHLKEHGGPKGAVIGDGTVRWKEVFELCETIGKTQWYIVEHESGTTPLEAIKGCLEGLRKMGK